MARAATTADSFNAVAEPRRRQILDALADGERPVNDLVRLLGLAQPQVSNGHALKPIHDWVKNYERSWSERFDQLDVVLEELKQKEERHGSDE
jgi:Bacterial regulatory protein, arsR family